MPFFIGSKDEFHRYIGGYCRNKVHSITNKSKLLHKSLCEFCDQKAELQAAHMRGMERKEIIDLILNEYPLKNDEYIVDLDKFENMFVKLHEPINEHFYFLCSTCHKLYDAGQISEEEMSCKHKLRLKSFEKLNKQTNLVIKEKKSIVKRSVIKDYLKFDNQNIDNDFKLYKRDGETVQDYVKRLFPTLYNRNMLGEQILINLQDKDYCKEFFGIDFSLFESDNTKTRPGGHSRYYSNIRIGGKYFLCSQWWKSKFNIYETKLKEWVSLHFKEIV